MSDVSILRENIRGVKGALLTRNGEVIDVDVESVKNLEHLCKIIFYLADFVCEKKGSIRRVCLVSGDQLFLFFHNSYVLGIIGSPDVNTFLLDMVAWQFLQQTRKSEKVQEAFEEREFPRTLAREIPRFNQPREKVLSNAPAYAGRVLRFVDGIRTIRDIIEQSELPPEVVLDVILAYSKESVIVF